MLLRAKYVYTGEPQPIKDAAVRLDGAHIGAVGSARTLSDATVVDFGHAVILPGFVNAHTHLELTHLAEQVPPTPDFFDWLERLRATMYALPNRETAFVDGAREGVRQLLMHGVTTVGDITSYRNRVREALRTGPVRIVSFGEVIAIGRLRDRLSSRLEAVTDGSYASDWMTVGISPHAPFTLEGDGLRACAERAKQLSLPLCMHLGETKAETKFTEIGDGPCREFLQRVDVWDDQIKCPQMPPTAWANACGLLTPRTVIAHGNYLTHADIQLLRSTSSHVAFCPRTHAAFGHDPHPFRDMLKSGVNVCIGTDSLACNPSLSVLDELRFLRQTHSDLDAATLIHMGTLAGAQALGLDGQVGSLEVAKSADVTVIPLDQKIGGNPLDNILFSSRRPVATFVRGQRKFG